MTIQIKNYQKMTKKLVILLFSFSLLFSCTEERDLTTSSTETQIDYDDISYSKNDLVLGDFILEVADKLRAKKQNNTTISESDLNKYADSLISKKSNANAKNDMDSYITGNLNSKETALYNSNKAKALLCMSNGKLAVNYAKANYYPNYLANKNGDAFRHALWNFGMTKDVGSNFAKTWGDAHEYGSTSQPAIQRSMDLYNNSFGILLGLQNANYLSHSAMISKTKEKVRAGKLKIINGNNTLIWSSFEGEK